jgi:plastocyanin
MSRELHEISHRSDRSRSGHRKREEAVKSFVAELMFGMLVLVGVQLAQAGDSGSVSGKVKFRGAPPPARKIRITTDPSVCGAEQQSEDVVVGAEQGVRYAVVRLIGAKAAAAAAPVVAMEQKGCKFVPHVLIVRKGSDFDIVNGDGILHNIHTHSTANPEFDKAQPGSKKTMSQKFDKAETIKISCDVHPWMRGWIVVAEDAFTVVTDETGSFKLPNVPPGTYKLEVWHEKFGTQSKEITVKAGGDSSIIVEFGG